MRMPVVRTIFPANLDKSAQSSNPQNHGDDCPNGSSQKERPKAIGKDDRPRAGKSSWNPALGTGADLLLAPLLHCFGATHDNAPEIGLRIKFLTSV